MSDSTSQTPNAVITLKESLTQEEFDEYLKDIEAQGGTVVSSSFLLKQVTASFPTSAQAQSFNNDKVQTFDFDKTFTTQD